LFRGPDLSLTFQRRLGKPLIAKCDSKFFIAVFILTCPDEHRTNGLQRERTQRDVSIISPITGLPFPRNLTPLGVFQGKYFGKQSLCQHFLESSEKLRVWNFNEVGSGSYPDND
jgi:hypothetical protein